MTDAEGSVEPAGCEGGPDLAIAASPDRAAGLNGSSIARHLLKRDALLATRPAFVSGRDSTRRRLLVAADVASLLASLAVTRVAGLLVHPGDRTVVVFGIWLAMNKVLGLYDRDSVVIDKWTFNELPRLAESALLAVVAILVVGGHAQRVTALEFAAILLAALWISRATVRSLALALFGPERALIIGTGEVSELILRKLRSHPTYGTDVVGFLDSDRDDRAFGGPALLGDLSRMQQLCRELRIERLIVAFPQVELEHILDAVRAGRALGVKVTIAPRLFEVLGPSLVTDEIEGMGVLSLRPVGRTRFALALKRAIDIVGAGAGLTLLSPLFALIALAVKLDSQGPVIFSQVRIGKRNKPFRIHKFRTMVQDAERLKDEIMHLNEVDLPLLKIPEDRDPRLTRVGRILRRTMLDELPQLWNVLRGEMSLVGPRPLEPQDDAEVVGWHRARLELTPGVTGPWQALGRHSIPFREMLALDCLYVADWSLWHDIKLLVRTAHVLLKSR